MSLQKQDTILITGAEGFVGSHLVEYLLQSGYSAVHGTCYRNAGFLSTVLPETAIHAVDLTDLSAVEALLQHVQPSAIVHLASLAFVGKSFDQAQRVMNTNSDIQYVLLEATRRTVPQARVLSIGSAAEYGMVVAPYDASSISEDVPHNPTNPYAVSKIAQEYLAVYFHLTFGLDIVRVRPFNQIGTRQTTEFAVPAFVEQIVQFERGELEQMSVGNTTAVRDFTDVRDAARAYEVLLHSGVSGEVYNLGSGTGVSMQQIIDELIEISGTAAPVVIDPERLRPIDVPSFIANADKLKQLGWQPEVSRKDTLRAILEYERTKREKQGDT